MLLRSLRSLTASTTQCRYFHETLFAAGFKALPPRRQILDDEITESFLKGSGPGGQKINKTNSAVQIKHLPTGIVVKSQETRSRDQNRKNARRILAEKLDEIELGENSRTAIRAARDKKKKASKTKKANRKYKALEEGKAKADGGEDGGSNGDGAVEDGSKDGNQEPHAVDEGSKT